MQSVSRSYHVEHGIEVRAVSVRCIAMTPLTPKAALKMFVKAQGGAMYETDQVTSRSMDDYTATLFSHARS